MGDRAARPSPPGVLPRGARAGTESSWLSIGHPRNTGAGWQVSFPGLSVGRSEEMSGPTDRQERIALLKAAMAERILVLDGAMGTMLQSKNLKAADFGGAELEGCNENLVL